MRQLMPNELGRDCNIGDIIVGYYCDEQLRVLKVEHDDDAETTTYTCRYLTGPMANMTTTIMSYFAYRRI